MPSKPGGPSPSTQGPWTSSNWSWGSEAELVGAGGLDPIGIKCGVIVPADVAAATLAG